jgi:DHA1 family bicyclomycin/chloramphenicol resistance-like MFS transporter
MTAMFGAFLIVAGTFGFGFWGIVVAVFLYVASLGMIFPNSNAGALAADPQRAGSASALLGSLQYGIAAIASTVVSHFNNGTAISMTVTIGVCGIAAFLALYLLVPNENRKFAVSEEHSTIG